MIFQKTVLVTEENTDDAGKLKLSGLLQYAQEISGNHSDQLGFDWDTLADHQIFWAVLRHRVIIHRLPQAGETVHLETWPMPATRAAYPRAVRATDCQGQLLFETVSLWVLMHRVNRTMILPGKSGVDVPGIVRGDEPAFPGSLPPAEYDNSQLWQVSDRDLDRNGHVNNARYLDHVQTLPDFPQNPRELTICYLAELLPGQETELLWGVGEDGILSAEAVRTRTDVRDRKERVFAVKVIC